ncbi:ERCC4 domain-containing protein [Microdochium trichocladiopsis]|uniref:ERCC4 domain-containing protein n=1 Tax=Microdochium trichocladiopsis TaxID=1682393 RepID=A0A9P8YJL7_9PEZI|nr:ERCC4 domain-containing protein [Microdochium trichocladiopsis]KAH7040621.1 ERCC4 domain-containing protein [Microdochium trichocladiopsis]
MWTINDSFGALRSPLLFSIDARLVSMPVEVIDLLSSSPIAGNADLHQPQHSAASASVDDTVPSAQSIQVTANVQSSLQFSDFPLISSSLPDVQQPAPLPNGAVRTRDAEILFLSDDFDSTGDLEVQITRRPHLNTAVRRTRSEATRTSTGATTGSATTTSAQIISPMKHSATTSRHRQAVEDFVSSDPFATSPPKISSGQKPEVAPDLVPTLSSDPFSSPPRTSSNAWERRTDSSTRAGLAANSGSGVSGASLARKTVDTIDLSSDLDDGRPPAAKTSSKGKGKELAAWDPISSSMPEMRSRGLSSPEQTTSPRTAITLESASESDSDGLPDLADVDFSRVEPQFTLSESPPPKRSRPKPTAVPKKNDGNKELEKAAKAKAREAEKERKRLEREQAKSLKATEKLKQKALEEVNKKRTNHKISTPEMIVDLPTSLRAPLKLQIETLLGDLGVDYQAYHSATDNVVKWRRKVSAVYDLEEAIWRDIPPRILPEEHVLAILEAPEFVKLALGTGDETLESHIARVRATAPNAAVIYIIEGLNAWMRKNRNVRNRQYIDNVRSQENEAGPSQPRKRKAQSQEYIDGDSVEDALLSLQVIHGALIHQTGAMVETAQWVSIFTQHISTVPYRRAQAESADAGFCMEAGQVRTGQDSKDTYIRMLQEIARITAPIAYGIASEYPSLRQLIDGLEANGPLALAECRKSANQDGAFSDRKIGPAVSKRVHKIFTGRDPGSTDV